MSSPDFGGAYAYVASLLETQLALDLYYHSPRHTLRDVLPAAERLAKMEGVSDEDRLLVATAALYHDLGYIEAYTQNEAIAVRMAAESLPRFGFNDDQIMTIGTIIMATQMPQQPKSLLQQIICDADMDALGRSDFFITSHSLRLERKLHGEPTTLRQWYEIQLAFVQAHQYFTPSARRLREPEKQRIIAELRELLNC